MVGSKWTNLLEATVERLFGFPKKCFGTKTKQYADNAKSLMEKIINAEEKYKQVQHLQKQNARLVKNAMCCNSQPGATCAVVLCVLGIGFVSMGAYLMYLMQFEVKTNVLYSDMVNT